MHRQFSAVKFGQVDALPTPSLDTVFSARSPLPPYFLVSCVGTCRRGPYHPCVFCVWTANSPYDSPSDKKCVNQNRIKRLLNCIIHFFFFFSTIFLLPSFLIPGQRFSMDMRPLLRLCWFSLPCSSSRGFTFRSCLHECVL